MPTIAILAAGTFAGFAVSLSIPLLAALFDGDRGAVEVLVLMAVGYGFGGLVTALAFRGRRRAPGRAGVFAGSIVVWGCLVLAALPPFMLIEGRGVAAALFEASSAATTIGVSLRPVEEMAVAMVFYRATIAWLGGLATLLMAVYILGPYQVGGTPNANLRRVQRGRAESGQRAFPALWAIFLPYVGLTLLCCGLLIMCRISAQDAIVVAMSMLSTNGFMPAQTGESALDNSFAEIVMIVFMVVGATSIVWHRLAGRGVFSPSPEQREATIYLGSVAVIVGIAILAAAVWPVVGSSGFESALTYVFDAVSVATTTGISHDNRIGLSVPFELVLLIVFVGGCSYSTAGGIKAFRIAVMLRHVGNELERLVYPNAMLTEDVQNEESHRAMAKAVWSAFFLAILTITIAILVFAGQGYPLPTAMALAAGGFSQVGNLISGAVPLSQEGMVAEGTLLTIAALGLVARIEILVLLAALTGKRW